MDLEKLKYPIGKRSFDPNSAMVMKKTWIETIKKLPSKLENLIEGLNESDLNQIYRPDGWTMAQVIHHLADSHMNAYVRTKLALTQDHPSVFGYEEADWAKLTDASSTDINSSINIVKGIHERWVVMWDSMNSADFEKKYHHLGYKNDWTMMSVLNLYAWHSEHHLAHLHQALKYRGEFL